MKSDMVPRKLFLTVAIVWLSVYLPMLLGVQWLPDGSQITPTQATTFQGPYKTVASLSACNGEPGVTARDYASLAAIADTTCSIWSAPLGSGYAEFRFQIDADSNTATVQAWTAAYRYDPGTGTNRDQMDSFSLAWQWAITGGQQTAPNSNVFADTITATDYWPSAGTATDAGGTNRIARYTVDLRGIKYVAFVRTDSDANLTVYVDERHYQ